MAEQERERRMDACCGLGLQTCSLPRLACQCVTQSLAVQEKLLREFWMAGRLMRRLATQYIFCCVGLPWQGKPSTRSMSEHPPPKSCEHYQSFAGHDKVHPRRAGPLPVPIRVRGISSHQISTGVNTKVDGVRLAQLGRPKPGTVRGISIISLSHDHGQRLQSRRFVCARVCEKGHEAVKVIFGMR
jgi:hypothetical protein